MYIRRTVISDEKSVILKPLWYCIITILLILCFVFFYPVKTNKITDDILPVVSGYSTYRGEVHKDYYLNYNPIGDPDPEWTYKEKDNTSTEPVIAGKSAIIIDLNTNKVLYDKDITEKMKIASLAKVMTAVVVLEHLHLNDVLKVSDKAATIGENTMGVSTGESYTVKELLYGLVLASGNDAAYVLAEGTAGDVHTFVEWMNIKARELNLSDTSFYDPSGLLDDTYSTAVDLAKLTRYALKSQDFKDIVKTEEIELISDQHKYIKLENQTNLLATYPGVEGVKTGYTEEAGLCLITYNTYKGNKLVGVVLNSIDRKGDMILMLDHALGTLGYKLAHHLLD